MDEENTVGSWTGRATPATVVLETPETGLIRILHGMNLSVFGIIVFYNYG